MGTNGAFGGSGAAAWDQVRDEWTSLGGQSTDAPSNDAPGIDGDPAYDALLSAIAGL